MEAAWAIEREGKQVIHLEVGQPDLEVHDAVVQSAAESLKKPKPYHQYVSNLGIAHCREAAAQNFNRLAIVDGKEVVKVKTHTTPDQIVVTPGCAFAVAAVLQATASPGDEVLIPDPAWPNYEMALLTTGVTPVRYTLDSRNSWQPDFDSLKAQVTERTKALVICSPSNPTGQVFDLETLERLLEFGRSENLFVISDEIYGRVIFGESVGKIEGESSDLLPSAPSVLHCNNFDPETHVVLSGVSKTYSMTGFRVGFLRTSNPHMISGMVKLSESYISCGVPFAQAAATTALTAPEVETHFSEFMLPEYRKRRDLLLATFDDVSGHGFRLASGPPVGAMYCLLYVGDMLTSQGGKFDNVEDFCVALLKAKNVATSPGNCFGENGKEHIRICFAAAESPVLEDGLKRLVQFVNEHTQ
eukprot:gnl/MRDRNA2_/MRDRNA2_214013_c0_seq1.p1 gnl/MRDRNA2_/MRDRNA2_214013_c0~~gnl/MRDRNA2_/MRDRNA2_214013_c0_seq1.p1  ORF type:complete len:472 (-),score=78.58 gnl/MRDRNA2_/MRDRNA2_214013_c0_seq1:86-1330(-)